MLRVHWKSLVVKLLVELKTMSASIRCPLVWKAVVLVQARVVAGGHPTWNSDGMVPCQMMCVEESLQSLPVTLGPADGQ